MQKQLQFVQLLKLQRNYTKYSAALYWKKMHGKPNDNFFPIEEGVKLIKRGGFAFYMDMASGYKIVAGSELLSSLSFPSDA